MKILICDDEQMYVDDIRNHIELYASEKRLSFDIDSYTDAKSLLDNNPYYDIAFLDVEIGNIKGTEVAKRLKKVNKYIVIFIITSYNKYLDEAMDLNVLRFIVKQKESIDITNELTTVEQLLVKNNELKPGIYFNEKCRTFFEDKFNEKSVFLINKEGFLESNLFGNSVSENDYESIVNYHAKGLNLIISINQNPFKLKEQNHNDYYIIDSINDTTDIVVFNTEKVVDFDEKMLCNYLIEIIDILEETHQTDITKLENNDKDSDVESADSDSTTKENVIESNNNDSFDTIIEDKTADIEVPSSVDSKGTNDGILINSSYINISSETLSRIVSSTFSLNNYQEEVNSIYVSNDIKFSISPILETWYNNEYHLYNNQIRISESLILNSANTQSLENGIKYIFLGQDNDGNLLSVKVSDNINKNNGILKLMNSNYSTLIVSYNQLLQNGIEINSNEYFCLMYCDNHIVIAINTTKCEQNGAEAKEYFNNIISDFLSANRIETVQPYGIAVGYPIVYSGPGKNGYAAVGSLDPFDSYETIYKELGFQYIKYEVGSTGTYKRGYIDQYGGGSGTIPSNYKSGMGAKVKNGCTVYSGPATSYATVGSVSSNESITLLSTTSVSNYYYIEYSSSNGSKRGYIPSSNTSTISNTGLGVTLKDIEVYDAYVVNSGSLFKNEYFVVTGINDSYYRIEYNISTGRKIGYVHKSEVTLVNSSVTIPTIANSSALQAVPKLSTNVYAGPSTSIYANIGSVDSSDTVGVLGKEGSYYYIQYSTASGAKRGYVSISAMNSFSGSGNVKSTGVESSAAYADAPSANCTVYSCPNSNCATIGSIGAYEGITVFSNIKSNGYTFIEYSTSSNTKRGFINTSLLKEYNEGLKAQANKDINIYYTSAASLKLGSIYDEEYVIVLGKTGSYYYIEYNSPSGRKRGYIIKTALNLYSSSSISSIATSGETVKMNSARTVYSGPSSTYASVGSVSQNEYVVLIDKGTRGWYLIDYSAAGTRKQGYVPKSSVASTSTPINSEISYPVYTNAERHIMEKYTSGLGKDLVYYTIGDANSDNVLFLNFAIHGHEDRYSGDGMGLVKMAFKTLSVLNSNFSKINANDWFIIIIPTFNPDGIINGDDCSPGSDCAGIGRHNAVQMTKNSDGTWSKYSSGLGHIDMNRCFPYNSDNDFYARTTYATSADKRNYTGPAPMMAQEAGALSELINKYKNQSGTKYFIDIHGWTQQIIFVGNSSTSPFKKAFYDNGFNQNSLTNTLDGNGARGYVSRYAYTLGYQACLFEFPKDTDPTDFFNDTYGDYFIKAIKYLLDI